MSTSDKDSMSSIPSPSRTPRPMSWLVFALAVIAVVAVSGLIVGKRWWAHQATHRLVHDQVRQMLEGFEAAGLRVGEPRLLDGVALVEQAVEVDVDGSPVRILEFDPNEQSQAQELERIHRYRTTCVFGAAQPAEDNGPIVIIDPERHPSKEKLLECFRSRRMTIKSRDP